MRKQDPDSIRNATQVLNDMIAGGGWNHQWLQPGAEPFCDPSSRTVGVPAFGYVEPEQDEKIRNSTYIQNGKALYTPTANIQNPVVEQITNVFDNLRVKKNLGKQFAGANHVLRKGSEHTLKAYNQMMNSDECEVQPLQEALSCLAFEDQGLHTHWEMSPEAKEYRDAIKDKFHEWKEIDGLEVKGSGYKKIVEHSEELFEILKDLLQDPPPPPQEGDDDEENDDQDENDQEENEDQQSGDSDQDQDDQDENDDQDQNGGGDSDEDEESDDQDQDSDPDENDDSDDNGDSGDQDQDENDQDGDQDSDGNSDGDDNQDGDDQDQNSQPEGNQKPEDNGNKEPQKQEPQMTDQEVMQQLLDDLEGDDVEGVEKELTAQASQESVIDDPDRYVADTSKDSWQVPENADVNYHEARKSISNKVNLMTRYMKIAIQAITKARKTSNLERGTLDRSALYKLPHSLSKKIFYQDFDARKIDTAVEIIIDESASMIDQHHQMRSLAIALSESFENLKIPYEIIGASTDRDPGNRPDFIDRNNPIRYKLYKSFKERYQSVRLRLGAISYYSNFIDGEVVQQASYRLQNRTEKRKIIFVLCDGHPYAGYYHDHYLMQKNLVRTVKTVRQKGMEVYSFGIGTYEPAKFYGEDNFMYLSSISEMSVDFFKRIQQIISKGIVRV